MEHWSLVFALVALLFANVDYFNLGDSSESWAQRQLERLGKLSDWADRWSGKLLKWSFLLFGGLLALSVLLAEYDKRFSGGVSHFEYLLWISGIVLNYAIAPMVGFALLVLWLHGITWIIWIMGYGLTKAGGVVVTVGLLTGLAAVSWELWVVFSRDCH